MKLEELPKKIQDVELQIYSIENQWFDLNEEIAKFEIPLRIQICDQVDERGKAKYSNEQRREDEFWISCQKSEEYKDLICTKKKLLSDRDNLKIELKFYENTLKVMLKLQ